MKTRSAFVQTTFGRIHYRELGAGEPLILLHGNGGSSHEFEAAIGDLSSRYRCLAWDMPGHGDSEPWPTHLSVEDYARALVAFMDALGLAQAHVTGVSIGGMICIAMGARHPDRVSSLTIVESFVRREEEWARDWAVVERMFALTLQSAEQVAPRVRAVSPEFLVKWNVDRSKAGSWRMMDVMWAIRAFRARELLAGIRSPVSIIFGSRGPAIAGRADIERAIPQAKITVMEDIGHFPMIDDPAGFAALVAANIPAVMAGAGGGDRPSDSGGALGDG